MGNGINKQKKSASGQSVNRKLEGSSLFEDEHSRQNGYIRHTPGFSDSDAGIMAVKKIIREVCSGTAAHSGHARKLVLTLKNVAKHKNTDYKIKDLNALFRAAEFYKIGTFGRSQNEIALDLVNIFIEEFTSPEDELRTIKTAPAARQAVWAKNGVTPSGIDRMLIEAMHRTVTGNDYDYKNNILQAFRAALADGWGSSRIASMVSDILFGTPAPVNNSLGLELIDNTRVNIVLRGSSDNWENLFAVAAEEPGLIEYAKKTGATGIRLIGSGSEGLENLVEGDRSETEQMNQLELAVMTGLVEMIISPASGYTPGLMEAASCFHTDIISRDETGDLTGLSWLPGNDEKNLALAGKLLKKACDNYTRRENTAKNLPKKNKTLVSGFSVDAIKYMLGGTFRASFRMLNDAIISGCVKGFAAIVRCCLPGSEEETYVKTLVNVLVKKDILVLETGCRTGAEVAGEDLGEGLKEFCDTVGLSGVIHIGGCVDTTRTLEAAVEIIREGGLGTDITDLPLVSVIPAWASEKISSIAFYMAASGVDVIVSKKIRDTGNGKVARFLTEETKNLFGASFYDITDPLEAVSKIEELITSSRKKLGLNKKQERTPVESEDWKTLKV